MDNDADWAEWEKWCKAKEQQLRQPEQSKKTEKPLPPNEPLRGFSGKSASKIINGPVCECGAEKCNTTHATWCPKYKNPAGG